MKTTGDRPQITSQNLTKIDKTKVQSAQQETIPAVTAEPENTSQEKLTTNMALKEVVKEMEANVTISIEGMMKLYDTTLMIVDSTEVAQPTTLSQLQTKLHDEIDRIANESKREVYEHLYDEVLEKMTHKIDEGGEKKKYPLVLSGLVQECLENHFKGNIARTEVQQKSTMSTIRAKKSLGNILLPQVKDSITDSAKKNNGNACIPGTKGEGRIKEKVYTRARWHKSNSNYCSFCKSY